jgi:uncharacterized protein (DUF1330 family)
MAAYVIAQVQVTDPGRFQSYLNETPRTLAPFGGRFVARGGKTVVLEGEMKAERMVLIEFPSFQRAQEWYASEEYQRVKTLRAGAATVSIIAVEGYFDETPAF